MRIIYRAVYSNCGESGPGLYPLSLKAIYSEIYDFPPVIRYGDIFLGLRFVQTIVEGSKKGGEPRCRSP